MRSLRVKNLCEKIVSGTTVMAIKLFKQLERTKRRVKELEIQLEPYVRNIPEGEMAVYEENVERIKKKEATALEKFNINLKKKRFRRLGL